MLRPLSRLWRRAMRASLPVAAALAPLLAAAPLPVRADIDRAAYLRLAHSVARLEVSRRQGGVAVGSAVTVARGIVVTNCHVTRDAIAIRLAGRGMQVEATDQYADPAHDLCYLRAPDWTGEAVPVGEARAMSLGERVVAIGYVGGPAAVLRAGQVRALHLQDDAPVIESSSPFTSGASGGGLFDRAGALVGILTFRSRGEDPNFYSVPAEWIRRGLEHVEQNWRPVAPLGGATAFWEQRLEQLPHFLRVAALEEAGRWEAVLDSCRLWVVVDPRNPAPYVARGRSYRQLGYPLAARQAFDAALRRAPDDSGAWLEVALLEIAEGHPARAQRAAERLSAIDAGRAEQLRRAAGAAMR